MRTRSCYQVGDLFNPLISLKRGSDCFMFIMHDDADHRLMLGVLCLMSNAVMGGCKVRVIALGY